MFARVPRVSNKFIPLAVGTAAVACSAFYATRFINPIKNESAAVFTGEDKWIDLKLKEVNEVSHDTKRFTFALPSPDSELGLTLCSALMAKFVTPKGSNVIRPYTPVSELNQKGEFELVIKGYPDGKMTNHLFSLKPSDTLSFKGPIKKHQWQPNSYDSITLLGAGSGITPLFQLLRSVAKNPEDKTKVNLFYGNKTPGDILLKKELDDLQQKYSDQVKITYFVDKSEGDFKGETGFITKDFIAANSAKPDEKTHFFVCGPPPFMEAISGNKKGPAEQGELKGALKDLGFKEDQVFKF
ncbi:hypothetical protein ZYGR_0I04530 [Zygosaccharomyces rouxii]|uniref:NADH-cytochrome b5 reductase n=1 Tax=Zygosaccharomyces rouxii TaxID=4956 RepID=A0A1Q2ZX88_ZYGRO|nr:hypothetical protein ZYGR_0I04530 [Zygosaccharomyces rouxii]